MTPLMQSIFEELCHEHSRTIFERYALIARARSLVELEAMFQAAYAAARELA